MEIKPREDTLRLIDMYEKLEPQSAIYAYAESILKSPPENDIKSEDDLISFLRNEGRRIVDLGNILTKAVNDKARPRNKLTSNELVYLILLYVPTINLMTSSGKGTLAHYQFFDNMGKQGIYAIGEDYTDRLFYRVSSTITASELKTAKERLKAFASPALENNDKSKIIVGNGIYDRNTNTLLPFTPERIFTSKIKTKYNPDAKLTVIHNDKDGTDWDIETWLKDIAGANVGEYDEDTYKLFWQIISATVAPGTVKGRALFFYQRKGGGGKGTFGQLLKNLVGPGNYSSLPIKAFNHNFMKELIIGKSLNIADENPVDEYIDDVMDFKASVTGDDVLIDIKSKTPIVIQPRMVNIQMLNGYPKTKDKSGSFYRRILFIPFLKSFTHEDPKNGVVKTERKYIKDDYINRDEVLEYVLKTALEMEPFDDFITPKRSLEILEDYKEANDSVAEFWNYAITKMVWDIYPWKFLFEFYKSWFAKYKRGDKYVQYTTFREQIADIIENNQNYECRDPRNKKHKSPFNVGNAMNKDEPLITKFAIKDYYNPNVDPKTADKTVLRQFKKPTTAWGVRRVTPADDNTQADD